MEYPEFADLTCLEIDTKEILSGARRLRLLQVCCLLSQALFSGARLFSMPHDSFMLSRLPLPFSLSLRFYDSSAIIVPRAASYSKLIYVRIEGCAVYLILLESHNVLVQPFSRFRTRCLVIGVRVGEIGCMELKVRRIVNQELF